MDCTYSGFLRTQEKFYTCGEEIANAISHGLAVVASIVGLVFLILYGIRHGNALAVTTFSIFGSSLIVLYLASTLYHAIPNVRAKKALQVNFICIPPDCVPERFRIAARLSPMVRDACSIPHRISFCKYFLSFFDNFVKSDGNICTAPQNGVS